MIKRTLDDVIERPELRMYFLVMYNISPIQQGIQALHACVEYQQRYNNDLYDEWAEHHKTVVLLNGGTSNWDDGGSMEEHVSTLEHLGVDYAFFREPDANMSTTAIAFIVEEKNYNFFKVVHEGAKYPDLDISDWPVPIGLEYDEKDYEVIKFIDQFRLA